MFLLHYICIMCVTRMSSNIFYSEFLAVNFCLYNFSRIFFTLWNDMNMSKCLCLPTTYSVFTQQPSFCQLQQTEIAMVILVQRSKCALLNIQIKIFNIPQKIINKKMDTRPLECVIKVCLAWMWGCCRRTSSSTSNLFNTALTRFSLSFSHSSSIYSYLLFTTYKQQGKQWPAILSWSYETPANNVSIKPPAHRQFCISLPDSTSAGLTPGTTCSLSASL